MIWWEKTLWIRERWENDFSVNRIIFGLIAASLCFALPTFPNKISISARSVWINNYSNSFSFDKVLTAIILNSFLVLSLWIMILSINDAEFKELNDSNRFLLLVTLSLICENSTLLKLRYDPLQIVRSLTKFAFITSILTSDLIRNFSFELDRLPRLSLSSIYARDLHPNSFKTYCTPASIVAVTVSIKESMNKNDEPLTPFSLLIFCINSPTLSKLSSYPRVFLSYLKIYFACAKCIIESAQPASEESYLLLKLTTSYNRKNVSWMIEISLNIGVTFTRFFMLRRICSASYSFISVKRISTLTPRGLSIAS